MHHLFLPKKENYEWFDIFEKKKEKRKKTFNFQVLIDVNLKKKSLKISIMLSLKSEGGDDVMDAFSEKFRPKITGFLCDFCDVSFLCVLHL